MPRRGGAASKYGHRYEDRWTADCAMRVLSGEACAIELEGPNAEIGFEFSLATRAGDEFHQVKRQRSGEGRWTLAALAEARVLQNFRERLSSPEAICVFASAHAAHPLDELIDEALKARTWPAFKRALASRLSLKGAFEELCRRWEAEGAWSWEALRRVQVATSDERRLARQLTLQAQVLMDGPSDQAPAILIEILRDRVDQRLEAEDLWQALAGHGFTPKARDGELPRAEVDRLNARFRRTRQSTLIGGELIPRRETDALERALEEERIVFLHGEAGSGKSDVLLELCDRFAAAGVPHLALRLDRQDPAVSAQQLGEGLGLDGSPAAVLAQACPPGASACLIIDQLDALSTTSGRNPRFFEAVAETIDLALARPGLRVVLACRSFDATNDSRLRRLAVTGGGKDPTEIEVGLLEPEVVDAALERLGIEASGLDGEVRRILRVPIHLSLLAEVSASGRLAGVRLRNLHDLHEAYWSAKAAEVDEARGGRSSWTEVLDRLVDQMSADQALAAPAATLDPWPHDREAMISAGVLVEDEGRLAFFHETFFDYAFARRLVGRGESLEQLLSVDQFLFRRSQVRQVLDYSRRSSPVLYRRDLAFLLGGEEVRFHLKDLAVAWLAGVEAPTEEEWRLLEPALGDPDHPLHSRAWTTVCAPAWFHLLDSSGRIERWLGEEERREKALLSLTAVAGEQPARVDALLRPYLDASDEWRRQISGLLGRANLGSRELVDLQLSLIASGSAGDGEFWWGAHGLGEEHPDWVCELLGAYLEDRLGAAQAAGVSNPFERSAAIFPANLHVDEEIRAAARGAPGAFAAHVWPVIVRMLEAAVSRHQGREKDLLRDEIWVHRHFGDAHDFEDHLLIAAEEGMAALARQDPERFEALLEDFSENEMEAVAYLLFKGLGANPARFAEAAVDYLLADPRRFLVAYSDGQNWATRKLLEAITPEASEQALARLEHALLDHYTPWERSKEGYRQRGLSQFTLLGGVAEDRRSAAVRKRFAEWQRKFNLDDGQPPFGIQGGTVGPPIAPSSAEKMSDRNWLAAIETYPDDDFANRRELLKGGAFQLAGVLQGEAKEDPLRFARLAEEIPDGANVAYFDAILRGVGESEAEVPLAVAGGLVRRCHRLPDRPCGRWITYPLRRHAAEGLPADLLEIVGSYAINGDPESMVSGGTGEDRRTRQMRGLNSVRGGVADEIVRFVAASDANVEPLRPAIESLLRDTDPGVREMALGIPVAELRNEEGEALRWFLVGIADIGDLVLDCHGVHEFLRYRATDHFGTLEPVIARMIAAEDGAVRRAGAAQAALAALERPEAISLLENCLAGGKDLRLGVARVLAANVATARFRALCESNLVELFDDPEKEVREEAAKSIRRLRGERAEELDSLIRSYLGSRAFAEDPEAIVFSIQEEELVSPELAMEVVEAVLATLSEPDDARTRDAMIAGEVNGVLMTIYGSARDDRLRNNALDLFDRALEQNSYGANRELARYDRG
jgi:hypothetical protein